ncbi:MAG: alpha/beta hydrolase [Glaciihabitans sp.]|nr:alpha/beta hydrolase [Glaciihabitans sp.]MDQ1572315.1 hypothetical protein [Actinomycetota bacterium]
MKKSRRLGIAALALAIVLPLSGCVSWFLPPTSASTSAPTGESVAADLAPYYHQVLKWTLCGDNLQCTDATAPLDWSNPSGAKIKLALIRQPATGSHRLGSLLVNPGGPGGSGYDFIHDSIDYATDKKLQASYDIVGFDPRGVNHSTPVSCYTNPSQLDAYNFDIPPGMRGSDEWIKYEENLSKKFGAECLADTGPLLGHVDTVSAARDLDLLRAALGDKKLNYLGYSYGTLLGQTYANLYPKNTGRLVLDGVVDPTTTVFDLSLGQAKGFEASLRDFIQKCPGYKNCPFHGSVDSGMSETRQLLDALDASPLRNKDGRELGSSTMFTAIIYPLYNVASWPALVTLFNTVLQGDPSYAFQLADGYYERDSSGKYNDNSAEAFIAINCLDYPINTNVAHMRAQAAELNKAAPVLGHLMAYGDTGCSGWPVPETGKAAPIHADGSAPILVVGTTGDPATPYSMAQNVAKSLQNGHLVTYHGNGHTAYNKSNACVNNAVDNFLINGTVPKSDPNC